MHQTILRGVRFTPEMDARAITAVLLSGESMSAWIVKACEDRLRREEVPFA